MKADRPTAAAYADAARLLSCEPAAIRAVADVEAGPGGAFLDTGEPVILYEPHVFHRLTGGRYDGAVVPGAPRYSDGKPVRWAHLSYPSWRRGWYGPVSRQHQRLAAAVNVDPPRTRDAALSACSWGLFQIMGYRHAECGFPELQGFVNAMFRSVDDHLAAFVELIRRDATLSGALRSREWVAFARAYNGPGYAAHGYHLRMAAAYGRHAAAACAGA